MSVATARTAKYGGTASTFNTAASPGAALTTLFSAIDTALLAAGWTSNSTASNNNSYKSTGESGTETLWLHLSTGAMGTGTGVNLSGGSYLIAGMAQFIDGSGNAYNEMGNVHLVNNGAGCNFSSSDLELTPNLSGWDYCIVADKNSLAVHVFNSGATPTNSSLMCGVCTRPNGILGTLVTSADYTFTAITNTNVVLSVSSNPITAGYTVGSIVDVVAQQTGPGGVVVQCGSTISANFIIGETVTQATSGASGKVYAYSTNFMAIYNVSGTFDNTHVVTGGTSGATFTASTSVNPSMKLTMRQGAKIVALTSTTITLDRLDNPLGNTNKLLTGALIGENPQPIYGTTWQGTTAWTYYNANTAFEFVVAPNALSSLGGAQINSWASQIQPNGSGGAFSTAATGNGGTQPSAFSSNGQSGTNVWVPDLRTNSISLSTPQVVDAASSPSQFNMGTINSRMYRSSRTASLDAIGTIRNPHNDLTTEYVCVYSTTQEMWMGPFTFVAQTATLSGASGTVGVIIGGTTVTVTASGGDNATATSLASAINANGTVNIIVSAAAVANVVTLTVLSTAARPQAGTSLAATGTGVTVNRAFVTYPYPALFVPSASICDGIVAMCVIPPQQNSVLSNQGYGVDIVSQYIIDRNIPPGIRPTDAFGQGFN